MYTIRNGHQVFTYMSKQKILLNNKEEDDESTIVTVIQSDDSIGEYPILLGRTVMVSNSQEVHAGELLTDGPINPHELLDCFFSDLCWLIFYLF